MPRTLWLGLIALALLAADAASARADVPAPDGTYHRRPWGSGAPPPGWFEQNGLLNQPKPLPTPDPAPKPQDDPPYRPSTGQPNPPKRTGPFRSCGSGMGMGLAGVALTWGMLWLGNRFVRSQRSSSARG